jgi:hypothetical protein
MKRLILVASAALVALLLPLRAMAQPAHADSPKATLFVTQDLVAGTVTLTPGEYRIQCKHVDGKTFLVIVSTETGKEVSRVPCVEETLEAKVSDTQYGIKRLESGAATLTWVRIKGETAQHKVVTE